jgi:glycosyltransferase involved in cell wall biosynthesis
VNLFGKSQVFTSTQTVNEEHIDAIPMLNVLMVGHACNPGKGSEHASTWNWAWHLSQHVRITLLTHASNRQAVEEYLKLNPNPNLRFQWISVPKWLDPWRPERNDAGIHLHYLLWQNEAFRCAAEMSRDEKFDMVHHVGWGSVSAPPRLWCLEKPFVWGPVGGGQRAPQAFLRYFGPYAAGELIRSLRVMALPAIPSVRLAARRSSLALATNPETATALKRAGAPLVVPFLDSGIVPEMLGTGVDRKPRSGRLTLLWAGAFEPRKALPLALEALAARPHIPARLLVAGDGLMRSRWERETARLGLTGRVEFLGWVPWREMGELYAAADAFVFTSLRDSFAAVNLEAMARRVPIITLGHQGAGAFVPEDAGIKVTVASPAECVRELGEAFSTVERHPEKCPGWGAAGERFARTQRWTLRAESMRDWYYSLVESNGSRPIIAPGFGADPSPAGRR